MAHFAKNVASVLSTRVVNVGLGLAVSIMLARALGPEGKGIYAVVLLIAAIVSTLTSIGVGAATIYHSAKRRYARPQLLGNNILLGLFLGAIGVGITALVLIGLHQTLFAGIPLSYLWLSLPYIPLKLLAEYIQAIFLGEEQFRAYNFSTVVQSLLPFLAMFIALYGLDAGVLGALLAGLMSQLVMNVFMFRIAQNLAGGVSFRLHMTYIKELLYYGSRAHLGTLVAFLNYRLDLLLINGFLNPAAVGFYSLGVGLAERLLLLSQSASLVLFPRVSAETDELKRKQLTPLIARAVFFVSAIGAFLLWGISSWIVEVLYSADFLPAVRPLQILLLGIVAIGVSRVLSSDIAGRGHPILNTYVGIGALLTNLILNVLWIPAYGISGAAWASVMSYVLNLIARLLLYCHLSGNSLLDVVCPTEADRTLYGQVVRSIRQRVKYRFSTQV